MTKRIVKFESTPSLFAGASLIILCMLACNRGELKQPSKDPGHGDWGQIEVPQQGDDSGGSGSPGETTSTPQEPEAATGSADESDGLGETTDGGGVGDDSPSDDSGGGDDGEIVVLADGELADTGAFKVHFRWTDGPRVVEEEGDESIGVLTIATADGFEPENIVALNIEPWMGIHNHGTGHVQPIVTQHEEHAYLFRVANIAFTMSGPWELKIKATVDGQEGYLEWKVDVP